MITRDSAPLSDSYNVPTVRFSQAIHGFADVMLGLAFSFALPMAAQAEQEPLQFDDRTSQTAVAGEYFEYALVAHGGIWPYTWSRVAGELPPGLRLHPHKGTISGTPATPGAYRFSVAITDSNIPQQQVKCDLNITVIEGLMIDWKQPPKVQGGSISGSLIASNQTGHPVDLTVIIAAVNSSGRATALGYQHFMLAAQTSSPEIPFRSTPGPGTYFVRADAAAHRKNGHHVFRASKQTDSTIEVAQF